ncbi:cytochrome P450 2J4-like [Haliotis rufescens]|uniref:cytochrome P450 2J4-like n=1 Tax=Haliotis rufescens TaxID=6454 RepID=UPI00201EAD34|nr:cytochrome P450 2J4-like [Haliotis rufescens]
MFVWLPTKIDGNIRTEDHPYIMWDLFEFSPTTVLVLGVVLAALWLLTQRPAGLPPGPPLLPVFGNALSMGADPRVMFNNLRQTYGDIFSVYVFHKPIIVLNGYSVLKDAIVKNSDVFSDRPHSLLNNFILRRKGVVASSGDLWREQRRFALCTLREFGVGRSMMEDKIHDEVSQFLAAMEMEKSEGFDCTRLVHNAACNVICSTAFGRRFEYSDPLFRNFLKAIEECFETTGASCLLNILPMLRFLPGDLFGFKRTMDNVRMIESLFIQPMIEEHLNTHDDNKVDNFIYAYIKEMRHRQKQQESTSLNLENLRTVITDLFVAGSESIATTIRWALVYFLKYPDVQEKCFQEIQENIGQSRQPSMKDKTNLPYVEATIMEVLRHADIAPVSALHTVPHDVHFRGFNFPKGVPVALMLDSVLQDPDVWGDPDRFRPDRFLDDTGKIQKKDEFIPFSLGRRVCLGEAMARMELFLFLTTMLQRFQFVPVNGQMPSLQGNIGLTHCPKPFLIKSIPRVQSLYSQKSNK